MNTSFNLASLVEYLKAQDAWHKEEMEKKKAMIQQLEQQLDEAYLAYERHNGACGVISGIRKQLNQMVKFSQGPSVTDPMAHSDQ
jgi:hypothetical protein